MKPKEMIVLIARLAVGGVLIYSGFSKAIAPGAEFAAAIAAYKILPSDLIPTLAMVWPYAELLVGTYLLFGYFTRYSARIAAGMFLIFLAVLSSAIIRGIDPGSCGCFGLGLKFSLQKTLAMDSILLIISLLLCVWSGRTPVLSVDNWAEK